MNWDKLLLLIEEINTFHLNFSINFFSEIDSRMNLKKKQVRHVLDEEKNILKDFLSYIENYSIALNEEIAINEFGYDYSNWDFRVRVKQQESIQNKLKYYFDDRENGKIALQKCLNDILRYRIVLNNFLEYESEFENKLDERNLNIRKFNHNDASETYHAYHIYFKNDNNQYFPWELQIWDITKAEENEKSHREHKDKREYLNWAKDYQGDLEKG